MDPARGAPTRASPEERPVHQRGGIRRAPVGIPATRDTRSGAPGTARLTQTLRQLGGKVRGGVAAPRVPVLHPKEGKSVFERSGGFVYIRNFFSP